MLVFVLSIIVIITIILKFRSALIVNGDDLEFLCERWLYFLMILHLVVDSGIFVQLQRKHVYQR